MLDALNQVSVTGANGDQRGFNENNHEGVVDDDVYFARFEGMTFTPVKDDPLSSTLAADRPAALTGVAAQVKLLELCKDRTDVSITIRPA